MTEQRKVHVTDQLDLTLFVPCLNEEPRVKATLDTIRAAMRHVRLSYEVIVVDDGSTDRTYDVAREYQLANPEMPLRVLKNPINLGVAHTYVDVAFLGKGEYFRLVWGDNVEPVESMVKLLRHIGEADLVIPYYPHVEGKGPARMALSRLYTGLINLLSGHSIQYYNGSCICRRYDVMRWGPRNAAFTGFLAGLVTRLLDQGATYTEVPVAASHVNKEKGASPLRVRTFILMGFTLLEILVRRIYRVLSGQHREPAKAKRASV